MSDSKKKIFFAQFYSIFKMAVKQPVSVGDVEVG